MLSPRRVTFAMINGLSYLWEVGSCVGPNDGANEPISKIEIPEDYKLIILRGEPVTIKLYFQSEERDANIISKQLVHFVVTT